MKATKENCRKALEVFNSLPIQDRATSPEGDQELEDRISFVRIFLQSAEKRLPTETAVSRDANRRKNRATT